MARRKQIDAPPAPEPETDPDDVRDRFPRGCWICGAPVTRSQFRCEQHTPTSSASRRGTQKAK